MAATRADLFDMLGAIFTALTRLPWLLLIGVSACSLYFEFRYAVIPSFKKREWSIPEKSELVSVSGQFKDRSNGRTPYPFVLGSGQNIALYCFPYLDSAFQSCLNTGGLGLQRIINQDVLVTYFHAKDINTNKNVILSVKYSDGRVILSDKYQIKFISDISETEDQNKIYSPIIGVGIFAISSAFIIAAVFVKFNDQHR